MKKYRNLLSGVVVAGFAIFYLVSMVPTAQSYPPYLNAAQRLGLPAKNCTYCHTTASGGSGWNARGKWLVEQKQKRGADTIDVSWLKEYKAGGATKSRAKKRTKS